MNHDRMVSVVVRAAELGIGDVEDPENEAEVSENCWTLCIDAANDLVQRTFGSRPDKRNLAIEIASDACAQLGYPRPGRKPKKEKDVTISVDKLAPPSAERVVEPTGVHHQAYKPGFLEGLLSEIRLTPEFGGEPEAEDDTGEDYEGKAEHIAAIDADLALEDSWWYAANMEGITKEDLEATAAKHGLSHPSEACQFAYAQPDFPKRGMWSGESVWLYLTLRDRGAINADGTEKVS